jgi:16S rRNA (cytidine1402-2'-O)-methyltransferase
MPSLEALPAGLFVIATPIGHLGDITRRAADVLARVERLYAEDTRHSRKLLAHLGIDRKLLPCHEHNEEALAADICRMVAAGISCGLISDAGTPGISDPGFRLVRACRRAGLEIIPVPGPSALVTALSVSGLPTDQFAYFGFLPPRRAARLRHFEAHRASPATLVYFESTHRIDKFLEDAESVFGPHRAVCLARELTKQHESVLTGALADVRERFAAGSSKGEFVVLIAKEGYAL